MSESATPFPPRCRWLKRGVAVGVCVLVALCLLRWWWGREAQRRIDAVIADARAHGEPILPEDFPPDPRIPDSENAVASLYSAAGVHMSPNEMAWDRDFHEPASASDLATMRQIEADNRIPLAAARAARGKRLVNWGYRADPASFQSFFPRFGYLRSLADVLAYSARGELGAGNQVAALELVRDILAEGRAMDAHPSWVIVNLVGTGVDADGTDFIINNLPTFGGTSDAARPAIAASMRGLIADLLDENGLSSSIAHDFRESAMESLRDGAPSAVGANWLELSSLVASTSVEWVLQPEVNLPACIEAKNDLLEARMIESPSKPTADALPRFVRPPPSGGASALEEFDRHLQPGGQALPTWMFILICDRRAAAIMLALRLYQFDHNDALPEKLSALTPDYLPSLPADPMRGDGGTFCYLPHANPPVLYSVGLNGRDDGGSNAATSGRNPGYRWNSLDAVYPLRSTAMPGAATAPSTQAQNHN
jgi:hypothetical protein